MLQTATHYESGLRELTPSEIESVGGAISDMGLTRPKAIITTPYHIDIDIHVNWAGVLNELGKIAGGVVVANTNVNYMVRKQ